MLSMNIKNLKDINNNIKKTTLRAFKGSLKGTLKIGSIQMIKKGLFDSNYCFKVVITNKTIVNINDLKLNDFKALGYSNKQEYLKEPFNVNNNSPLRVKYDFKVVEVNKTRLKELNII